MKILIVDDDQTALEALENTLTPEGHEVISARDGEEALHRLRSEFCRLVISDWHMPGMGGGALCRSIRTGGFPSYVYLILVTGAQSAVNCVDGLSSGADDYITKPFHPEELRMRVRVGERVLALEMRDVAIFAMAKLAESRDPGTRMHLERMRTYTRLLAQVLVDHAYDDLGDMFPTLIYQTSPLHDIGKVGIPDCVLLKPGRLNDREFEIMKSHTTIGAGTLDAALHAYPGAEYLRLARDIALTHHERYDGTGYPSGLKGDKIPLAGRIVALADVYDPLTTKRVYKNAFSHDVARSIVVDERGKHFAPMIVDAFLECEEHFIRTRNELDSRMLVAVPADQGSCADAVVLEPRV